MHEQGGDIHFLAVNDTYDWQRLGISRNYACIFQVDKFEQHLDCLHFCSNIDCRDNCNTPSVLSTFDDFLESGQKE